jgi:hypothetical protein
MSNVLYTTPGSPLCVALSELRTDVRVYMQLTAFIKHVAYEFNKRNLSISR